MTNSRENEQNPQGADGVLTPEQFDKRWDSLKRYFKRKPLRALFYCFLLSCILGGPTVGWLLEQRESDGLNKQLQDLKSEHSTLETRYDNLETVVAPIIRQAGREFPGEEINTSLKKLVARLELQPVYSAMLNGVRLGPVNVLMIPSDLPSRLEFSLQNVGTAESSNPLLALGVHTNATKFLSGPWEHSPAVNVHDSGFAPHDEVVVYHSTAQKRLSVGRIVKFPELTIDPNPEILAMAMAVNAEGDGVERTMWRLWILPSEGVHTNSIVLTNQEATNALLSLNPVLLPVDTQLLNLWRMHGDSSPAR